MRRQITLIARVDHERAPPGSTEHQSGAQPGRAAADDDAVPHHVHVTSLQASRQTAKLVCHAGKKRGRRRPPRPPRLRELRMQRGLTLEEVASRSSIDVSTLSRLESGKRRLALDHLPRLAAALSMSTDELLRAPEAEDPRVRGGSHTHHDVTYWPLTRHGPAGGLHAYKIRVVAR